MIAILCIFCLLRDLLTLPKYILPIKAKIPALQVKIRVKLLNYC